MKVELQNWKGTDKNYAEEQLKMNDCYSDNKDWRVCKKQVSLLNIGVAILCPDSQHGELREFTVHC